MIMRPEEVKGVFKVKFKTPIKVKTLKEYNRIKEKETQQKKKIILRDSEDEVLFINDEEITIA